MKTAFRFFTFLALSAVFAFGQGVPPPVEATAAQTAAGVAGAGFYISPRRLGAGGSAIVAPTALIGSTTGLLSTLTVYDTTAVVPRGISNVQVSSDTASANFSGYKARGTIGAMTTIVTGDVLSNFRAWGYDGANYIDAASIRLVSSGTIGATRVPSQLEFYTATDASPSVLTQRLKIDNAGLFTFNTTGATLTALSTGAITLAASGTAQNVTLTPSTTGLTVLGTGVTVSNATGNNATIGGVDTATDVTVRGGLAGATIALGRAATGAITLTAQGTNQNITLTPSGSGLLSVTSAGAFTKSAIGTTSTDGLTLTNATAATGVTTVQMSGRIVLQGTAWDTAASKTVAFFVENLPATAATPTGTLKFGYSLNGAAATYPMTLTSAGALASSTFNTGTAVVSTSASIGSSGFAATFSTALETRKDANSITYSVGGYNLNTGTSAGMGIGFGLLNASSSFLAAGTVEVSKESAWAAGDEDAKLAVKLAVNGTLTTALTLASTGNLTTPGSATVNSGTAIPAGGTAGAGVMVSSTANFGIFFGSGAPTLSAAKGSLYLRSDGSATNNRAYINTDGSTTWTALTTAL